LDELHLQGRIIYVVCRIQLHAVCSASHVANIFGFYIIPPSLGNKEADFVIVTVRGKVNILFYIFIAFIHPALIESGKELPLYPLYISINAEPEVANGFRS
jgi:hypothetical protein